LTVSASKNSSVQRAVKIALLAVGSVPMAAFAADTSVAGLEEIVVSAQRRAENVQDVPLSMTVQSGEDLTRAGITDIRDLGNVAPGLSFNTQGPFASATIRGVQSMIHQAGADSPVAIYIDGVYQNNHTTSVFDLADVRQVTVLRGPQGTLFGRNATAGAIMIETLKPQYDVSGNVSLDYGHFNGSDKDSGDTVVKGYFTAPLIDDKLAFSISGYYRDLEGFLTNDVTGGRSGSIESYTVRGKLLFEPTDWTSFLLTASVTDRTDLYSGGTTALNGLGVTANYPDGVLAREPWHVASNLYKGSSPLEARQESVSLKADFRFDAGTLSSITAYAENESRYEVDLDTGTSAQCKAAFVCLDFLELTPNETFQQEITFASEKFGPWSFIAGAYYYHDDATFKSVIQPELKPNGEVVAGAVSLIDFATNAVVKTRAAAVFGEVNYSFSDTWHGILGVRYSREKKWGVGDIVSRFPTTGDEKDSEITPRVSIRHDLTPNTNVYFTYSRGFKSAVLSGFEQNDNVAGAETLDSYEIGIKSEGASYRVSASAFTYDYKDLQAQFWEGNQNLLANSGGAKITGLEVDALYQVTSAFQIQGGLAWLAEAEYEDFDGAIAYELPMGPAGLVHTVLDVSGHRMLKSPKLTGNLTLSYTADTASGTFTPSLTVFHSSKYWFDLLRRVEQEAYTTVNARMTFRPAAIDALELNIFGRNLTNEEYFTSSLLGPTADAPVYAFPRQIGIGASFSF